MMHTILNHFVRDLKSVFMPSLAGAKKNMAALLAGTFMYTTLASPLVEAGFWQDRQKAAQSRNSSRTGTQYAMLPAGAGALTEALPFLDGKNQGGVGLESLSGPSLPSAHSSLSPEQQKSLPAWLNHISSAHGTISQAYFAPNAENRPLIVHIQDVHEQREAQMNISGLINEIVGSGAVSLVGLEGATGAFDLTPYRTFPNKAVIGDVADFLVQEHMIGGGEHAGWTAEKDPTLWGVEEMGIYLKNLNSFKDSLPIQQRVQDRIKSWEYRLAQVKPKVFSPELKAFDESQARYKNGSLALPEYVDLLEKTIKLDTTKFPATVVFRHCLSLEKSLNFSDVEKERTRLIESLTKALSEKEIAALVQRTLLYKSGRLSYGGYYDSLQTICEAKGVSLSRFPAMAAYIKYVLASEQIKPEALLSELDTLQENAATALVRTPEERNIYDLAQDLHSLTSLAAFKMAPHDWATYQQARSRIMDMAARMDRLAPGADNYAGDLPKDLVPFEGFCHAALARDRTLTDNLLAKMKASGQKNAILLTGGFHTEGMTDLLRKGKVSYVVFTPTLTAVSADSNYLDFLKNRPALEKLFTQEKITTKAPINGSGVTPTPGQEPAAAAINAVSEEVITALAGNQVTEAVKALSPAVVTESEAVDGSSVYSTEAGRKTVSVAVSEGQTPPASRRLGEFVASFSGKVGRSFSVYVRDSGKIFFLSPMLLMAKVSEFFSRSKTDKGDDGKFAGQTQGNRNFLKMGQLVVSLTVVAGISLALFGASLAAVGSFVGFGLLGVLLHELGGHLLMYNRLGGKDGQLSFGTKGIWVQTGDLGFRKNAWVAIAGPAANILIAALAGVLIWAGVDSSALQAFAATNLVFGLTALVPFGRGSDIENFFSFRQKAIDMERYAAKPEPVLLETGVQNYAWGQQGTGAYIPQLLGIREENKPYAEVWIGAHPDLPSKAVLPTGTKIKMDSLVEVAGKNIMSPHARNLYNGQLPFLFKVLAAGKPLSIQVHPNKEQAESGFAKENQAGVDLKADNRNYKDPNHKPELIVAVTEFFGLRGFKPLGEIVAAFKANPELLVIDGAKDFVLSPSEKKLKNLYGTIMGLSEDGADAILTPLMARLNMENTTSPFQKTSPEYWVLRSYAEFPKEQHREGVFSVYLLNLIRLNPGKAMYLSAGVPHAYLDGVGMEIMANSNNVLRGGLTPKHVDVPELMNTVVFQGEPPAVRDGIKVSATETVYREPGDVPEFQLSRIDISQESAHIQPPVHDVETLIVLEAQHPLVLRMDDSSQLTLTRGQTVMIPKGVGYRLIASKGTATLYKATVPMPPFALGGMSWQAKEEKAKGIVNDLLSLQGGPRTVLEGVQRIVDNLFALQQEGNLGDVSDIADQVDQALYGNGNANIKRIFSRVFNRSYSNHRLPKPTQATPIAQGGLDMNGKQAGADSLADRVREVSLPGLTNTVDQTLILSNRENIDVALEVKRPDGWKNVGITNIREGRDGAIFIPAHSFVEDAGQPTVVRLVRLDKNTAASSTVGIKISTGRPKLIPPSAEDTLKETIKFNPVAPKIGTSGVRADVLDLRDIQIYAVALAHIRHLKRAGKLGEGNIPFGIDLRPTSPRLYQAVAKALSDEGLTSQYIGKISSPALTLYNLSRNVAGVEATGSHIPAYRNGFKFNRLDGELRPEDNDAINTLVAGVLEELLSQGASSSMFDQYGFFKSDVQLPVIPESDVQAGWGPYKGRFEEATKRDTLHRDQKPLQVVFYQHSAVGREAVPEILENAGAVVYKVGASETFVPIDTEAINDEHLAMLLGFAENQWKKTGPVDAIVSTDGDSDRPLVIGVEKKGIVQRISDLLVGVVELAFAIVSFGDRTEALRQWAFRKSFLNVEFVPGELLGAMAAEYMGADFFATPVSSHPGLEGFFAGLSQKTRAPIDLVRTKIGSAQVVEAMETAENKGKSKVMGAEANGGTLQQSRMTSPETATWVEPLATRDATLPIIAVLAIAAREGTSVVASVKSRFKGNKGATMIDIEESAVGVTKGKIDRFFATNVAGAIELLFNQDGSVTLKDSEKSDAKTVATWNQGDANASAWAEKRASIERLFAKAGYKGGIAKINVRDGIQVHFNNGEIGHFRPSGNASQLRLYVYTPGSKGRKDNILKVAYASLLKEFKDFIDAQDVSQPAQISGVTSKTQTGLGTSQTSQAPPVDSPENRISHLKGLREIARENKGPVNVIAIVNGGDGEFVGKALSGQKGQLFRSDGKTTVMPFEEEPSRGQFFGLLAAIRQWKDQHDGQGLDRDHVSAGIMMPGKGTRMSPLTQWAFGIKPFIPMLIRAVKNGPWLSAAAASIFSWTLVTSRLEALGFRGIAWKWGDEPQIASRLMSSFNEDLSQTDAIRVGQATVMPSDIEDRLANNQRNSNGEFDDPVLAQLDDLAQNKEWLVIDKTTNRLLLDLRRRPLEQLIALKKSLEAGREPGSIELLTHMGSPAFSYALIEAADTVYSNEIADATQKMDVDGFLFAALTMPKDLWDNDVKSKTIVFDKKNVENNTELADAYYAKVQRLKEAVNVSRGRDATADLDLRVLNMGQSPYWGDIGQLAKARDSVSVVNDRESPNGDFARRLAMIDDVQPDQWGNIVVGNSQYPKDGTVRNSVIIDSVIHAAVRVEGAVLVNSQVGKATIAVGAVVFDSTVAELTMGPKSYAHGVLAGVGEPISVQENYTQTSIPKDPSRLDQGFEQWKADMAVDVGKDENYLSAKFDNPNSFAEKAKQMRGREVSVADAQGAIAQYRKSLAQKFAPRTKAASVSDTQNVVPAVKVLSFALTTQVTSEPIASVSLSGLMVSLLNVPAEGKAVELPEGWIAMPARQMIAWLGYATPAEQQAGIAQILNYRERAESILAAVLAEAAAAHANGKSYKTGKEINDAAMHQEMQDLARLGFWLGLNIDQAQDVIDRTYNAHRTMERIASSREVPKDTQGKPQLEVVSIKKPLTLLGLYNRIEKAIATLFAGMFLLINRAEVAIPVLPLVMGPDGVMWQPGTDQLTIDKSKSLINEINDTLGDNKTPIAIAAFDGTLTSDQIKAFLSNEGVSTENRVLILGSEIPGIHNVDGTLVDVPEILKHVGKTVYGWGALKAHFWYLQMAPKVYTNEPANLDLGEFRNIIQVILIHLGQIKPLDLDQYNDKVERYLKAQA
ncbi:MAG: mannose-6-phosphate isomerase, class I [Elusimicrobia bacterium]|nr:mannose-6-phosphate isomerase, class I [Elusimicrobiota bacterium]